jgi:hypothetical protein
MNFNVLAKSSACLVMVLTSAAAFGRNVYLNGSDISSSRNQRLKGVSVNIDQNGDIHIEGPQYRVHDASSYMPLGKMPGAAAKPEHVAPNHLPSHPEKTAGAIVPPTATSDDNEQATPAEKTARLDDTLNKPGNDVQSEAASESAQPASETAPAAATTTETHKSEPAPAHEEKTEADGSKSAH